MTIIITNSKFLLNTSDILFLIIDLSDEINTKTYINFKRILPWVNDQNFNLSNIFFEKLEMNIGFRVPH